MIKYAGRYTKAIIAGVGAFATAYYLANADNHVTSNEWTTIAVAAVTTAIATWGSPNVDPDAPVVVAPVESSSPSMEG